MNRTLLSLAACAVLLVLVLPGVALGAAESQSLKGEFIWTQRDNRGDLEALFTPTGEGTWSVDFRFNFRGKDHVYSGTAEGSLTEGTLRGKVLNDEKNRTFTFSGAVKDGTFEGSHSEIEDGEESATGTLTLRR